jgi:hypothetical protein
MYGRIVVAEETDCVGVGVWSNGAGGGDVLLGIYSADRYWQPEALVAEIGTVSVATSGMKTVSCLETLPAGRYLTAIHALAAGGQIWVFHATPSTGVVISPNGPDGLNSLHATDSGTALPDPGVPWAFADVGWGPMREGNGLLLKLN